MGATTFLNLRRRQAEQEAKKKAEQEDQAKPVEEVKPKRKRRSKKDGTN